MSETILPDLNSTYSLSQEQIADFQRDGHLLVRGLASPAEVAAFRPAIRQAADQFQAHVKPLDERDTYGKAFLQIMNLWTQDALVRRFVFAQRFAQVAADLLGVNAVRLYHDQALYKEPGGGLTPWHQDQFYWPLDTNKTVTLWMPLVDVSVEMGALTFASGSQQNGFLGNLAISDSSQAAYDALVKERGYAQAVSAMQAGDATFHTGWTLHWAPGNQTDTMREVMTIIYYADGTNALQPDNENRAADLKTWLPGVHPGEPAASDLNPVLFQQN